MATKTNPTPPQSGNSEPIAEMPPPQDVDKIPDQAAADAAASITMTTDELAASTHPLAPKHPLEIPDAQPVEE